MDPKCQRCGNCCKSPFIVMENIKLDDGDPRELIRYYTYHSCEPMEKEIQGKKVLAIRIPIPCKHFNQEQKTCMIYENRPVVCKEFFCKKVIEKAVIKVGETIGIYV
jgi:Fe-S-cluster containining protein